MLFAEGGKKILRLAVFLLAGLFLSGCAGSIPNLEERACTEARESVKEFYSFHFGRETDFKPEDLKLYESHLTEDFYRRLQNSPENRDPFTLTEGLPKAFRIGGCSAETPEKARLEILLFWRTDDRSLQREITLETVKRNDKWAINEVFDSTAEKK